MRTGDPIAAARRATNRGNALSRANSLYDKSWKSRGNLLRQERWRDAHWKPAIRAAKKAFRREFRKACWKGLTIEWSTNRGWSESGLTRKVEPWLAYIAYWHGMQFHRGFRPEIIEDALAEAWKLAGALLGWSDRNKA